MHHSHVRVGDSSPATAFPLTIASQSRVAGSETTSVAIRMTLLGLLTNPHTYRKVQEEIDAYYAKKGAGKGGDDGVISYSDAKSLLYLQGAMREALRIWPPPAGHNRKEEPKGRETNQKNFLPEGTEIGQSMYGIGRQES